MGGIISFAIFAFGLWLLIKAAPVLLRFLLYCILALPLWIALLFLPGPLDESGLALILLLLAFYRAGEKGSSWGYSSSSDSSSSGGDYILNKKTGVIHSRWDSSVDTISNNHRRMISYSEAQDLVNRGTKYRFKQDP